MIIKYICNGVEIDHTDLDWIPKPGTNFVLARGTNLFYTCLRIIERKDGIVYYEVEEV